MPITYSIFPHLVYNIGLLQIPRKSSQIFGEKSLKMTTKKVEN